MPLPRPIYRVPYQMCTQVIEHKPRQSGESLPWCPTLFFPPARFYILHVCLSLRHFHFVRCCCIVHRSTHILPVHSAFTAAGQTHTRIYISPAYSLLTHQCTVGPPLCSVAFFIVCACVCCFAPLVGPLPSSTSSAFLFLSLFRWHCRSPDSLFQSLIYTYGKLVIIATVFIIRSTIYAEKYPQYFLAYSI